LDEESTPSTFSNIAASATSQAKSPAPGDAGDGAVSAVGIFSRAGVGGSAGGAAVSLEDTVVDTASVSRLCTTALKDFLEGAFGVMGISWNPGPAFAYTFFRNLGCDSPIGFGSEDPDGEVGVSGVWLVVGCGGDGETGVGMRTAWLGGERNSAWAVTSSARLESRAKLSSPEAALLTVVELKGVIRFLDARELAVVGGLDWEGKGDSWVSSKGGTLIFNSTSAGFGVESFAGPTTEDAVGCATGN
jgi:hypothetical protein